VLHAPRSITSDFNFPQWNFYGRGNGNKRQCHEYAIKALAMQSA